MKPSPSSKLRYRAFRRGSSSPAASRGVEAASSVSPGAPPSSRGDNDEKPHGRELKRHLRQYRTWLSPHFGSLALVFVLALASAGLNMVLPMVTKILIDDILLAEGLTSDARLSRLVQAGLATAALLVAAQGLDAWRSVRMSVLNSKVIFKLRERLFDRLLRLPLASLSEMKSGGIVSRLSGDVDSLTGLVQLAIITPGVAIIRVILTIGVLVFLSWKMALVSVLLIPPVVLINVMWVRKVRPVYRSIRDDRAEVDGRITETFGGIRVVRSFQREAHEEHDHAVGHHTIIRKRLYANLLQLVVTSGWGLLIPATTLLIVCFGGYLVIREQATVGDIFAFQMYAFMLLTPVSQIVNSWNETQSALAAMERVFEILDLAPEKPDPADALPAPGRVEEFRFDHVSFAYREGHPVLHGFDLTVRGGMTVALVGPSGAGKTTVTDLVARFHDPTGGALRLNGVDIRRMRLREYRGLVGVVQQEVFLFDGTVRDNLTYGRRGATDEEVIAAARRANAHDFIAALPEGYETLIGERGVKLSGGQRQRVSIARALLADPQILVLDEATSNLDTESEQLIQASLRELLRGRTTFVIAHRLSTVTHADLIVVMNQGRIVETGSHDVLMARGGPYREMVDRQRRVMSEGLDGAAWSCEGLKSAAQ